MNSSKRYVERRGDSPDKVKVGEDEGLIRVEPERDDVLCVPECKLVALLELEVRLEQELLVVCTRLSRSSAPAAGGGNRARGSLPVNWITSGQSNTP